MSWWHTVFHHGHPGTEASDTFARITREQWENYKTQFQPIEDQLIDVASNPQSGQIGAEHAEAAVNTAFQQSAASFGREQASYGVTMTPEQQAAYTRESGLAKGLATVESGNRVRDAIRDRNMSLMSGGLAAVPTTASMGG